MILFPYIEVFNKVRKGQDGMGINTIGTMVLIFATILVFVGILYYMLNNGKEVISVIDPLKYNK